MSKSLIGSRHQYLEAWVTRGVLGWCWWVQSNSGAFITCQGAPGQQQPGRTDWSLPVAPGAPANWLQTSQKACIKGVGGGECFQVKGVSWLSAFQGPVNPAGTRKHMTRKCCDHGPHARSQWPPGRSEKRTL